MRAATNDLDDTVRASAKSPARQSQPDCLSSTEAATAAAWSL
jgi:hypothetical protein